MKPRAPEAEYPEIRLTIILLGQSSEFKNPNVNTKIQVLGNRNLKCQQQTAQSQTGFEERQLNLKMKAHGYSRS